MRSQKKSGSKIRFNNADDDNDYDGDDVDDGIRDTRVGLYIIYYIYIVWRTININNIDN